MRQPHNSSSPPSIQRTRNTCLLTSILVGLILFQPGCQIFQRFRPAQSRAPIVFQQPPNQQQLLSHLNNQAAQVRQIKTNVRVSVDGMPTLRGNLAIERPKRLRLKAGLLGVSEMGVDVGSNSDVFWVWTKATLPGERPSIYYASHEAYQNSAMKKTLPLDPAWIINALGFVEFNSTDRHEGPIQRPDGRFEIRSYIQSPTGPSARVTVVDPKHGWVNRQSIYEPSGRLLAYVDSIKHKSYDVDGTTITLPQRIEIHVFQASGQEMKLVVDADEYTINSLYGDPAKLWTMPSPPDIPRVDLTRVSIGIATPPLNRRQPTVTTRPSVGVVPQRRRLFGNR